MPKSTIVHVVPHTHWDREWYQSAAVFGLRLAHLLDDLLDTLARDDRIPSFLLDGQGVVLDDLAESRPGRITELRRLLRAGRIEAGPWYVLADEFLVSGEALVRNLIEGGKAVRRYGGTPLPVGYVPDSFGHSGVMPLLLDGFGIGIAVAWRGLGETPPAHGAPRPAHGGSDLCRWRSSDGSEVLLHHLPRLGYEYGANLPDDPRAARKVWRALKQLLGPRARSPHWLVMNGADHHALQRDLVRAVRALGRAARRGVVRSRGRGVEVRLSGLGAWADAVGAWARGNRASLPVVEGELRAGRAHAWALLGTTATRLHLKQANAECQRRLERVAEPLAALAAVRGGADFRADLGAAWRELLRNQPHDSICGTSTDEVHREMTARFARVRGMTDEIVAGALDAAIGREADAARALPRERWRPAVVVFNPVPRRRDGLVEVDVPVFREDVRVGLVAAKLDARTRRHTDAQRDVEIVGPGGRVVPHQELARWEGTDLVESPRHYPDCDAVEWRRIVFPAAALPSLGLTSFAIRASSRPPDPPTPRPAVLVGSNGLDNGRLALLVESDGTISFVDRSSGLSAHRLGRLEDQADLGDSYTPSPRGPVTSRPDAVAVRVVHAGPLVGELEIARRYRALDLEAVTRVRLDAGARHLEFTFAGVNRRGDHRLRAAFPLGERVARVLADTGFGVVERGPAAAPRRGPGELEAPEPTAPLHRWVAVAERRGGSGLLVVTDGLPQYEASPSGTTRITLLRACGELSRSDCPERPGHAGWPIPTPEGQCIGPFSARIGVALVEGAILGNPAELDAIADDILLPPLGFQRRAVAQVPRRVRSAAGAGVGLCLSAMKPAEDGRGIILRCWNARNEAVRGEWVVPWRVRSAAWCRLDETDVAPLGVKDGRVAFEVGPRGVATVRLR